MPYRSSEIVEGPPPKSFVALLWRWILLRRADRFEAEERRATLALDSPKSTKRRVTIHMRRTSGHYPYEPYRIEVGACPGKSIARPVDIHDKNVLDYWLCTADRCCCEVES